MELECQVLAQCAVPVIPPYAKRSYDLRLQVESTVSSQLRVPTSGDMLLKGREEYLSLLINTLFELKDTFGFVSSAPLTVNGVDRTRYKILGLQGALWPRYARSQVLDRNPGLPRVVWSRSSSTVIRAVRDRGCPAEIRLRLPGDALTRGRPPAPDRCTAETAGSRQSPPPRFTSGAGTGRGTGPGA